MHTNRSKQTFLLLTSIYLLSSNCQLSNRYNVFGNEVALHKTADTSGPTQTIVNPYQGMPMLGRIINIKKTQNEYTKLGGTTVYLYDEQGRLIHAHTGGSNKAPYYKVEYIDHQLNIETRVLDKPLPEAMDRYIKFVGIMTDKEDLLYAPITRIGPFGNYGNLINPEKYEQIRAEINQRYANLYGKATADLVPPLEAAPLWYQPKYSPSDPNLPCIPGKSVCISVARFMNE
ncbi:MAG: hypothetical protein K2X94_04760 [Amoebophilaceae bacterium]|nr:hypothetical protein [Amoebophilaceae bacterium]